MDMKEAYNMLKSEFAQGYTAGYIDDEGYVLDCISIADFCRLKKNGMLRKSGEEFKIAPPLKYVDE